MLINEIKKNSERYKNHIALQIKTESGYENLTYNELWNKSLNTAIKLSKLGLKKGDHIALYADNNPNWVISYLAIHFLGGVIIPFDIQLLPENILDLLKFSDSKSILVDNEHILSLKSTIENNGLNIELIPIEDNIGNSAPVDNFEANTPDRDDLMTIIFTSGTTGNPKGVQLTHGNISENIKVILKTVKVVPDDNILNILPLHHGYPCIVGLLTPLYAGAKVTFSHSLKSSDLVQIMRETGVTILPGVPRLYTLLDQEIFNRVRSMGIIPRMIFSALFRINNFIIKALRINAGRYLFGSIHKIFGSKLRFFSSGGAKLEPSVFENFKVLGFKIIEGYGLTETSAVATLNDIENPIKGTAGKPIPGTEIKIHTPDSEGNGEICLRGPNITKGYYKNDKETKEILKNGWLHTGDLGRLDGDGNVIITGRSKEVIVLASGKNIYPEDVEKLYNKSPFIKELCILPLPSKTGLTEGLRLVIVPNKAELISKGVYDIRERLKMTLAKTRMNLPSYMHVNELIIYNEELPKTRLGKLKRTEIENIINRFTEDREKDIKALSNEERSLLENPVSKRFINRFKQITNLKGPFHPSQELSIDLGLDSLMLVQITMVLETEFGLKIDEEELSSIRTIGDILLRLESKGPVDLDKIPENDISISSVIEISPSSNIDDIFNLNRGFLKRLAISTIQLLFFAVAKILFKIEVRDINKLPKKGPFIICPTHQSMIDPFIMYSIVPGYILNKLLFTAFVEYFDKPPLSWTVKLLRIIPTGSTATYSESLRLCYRGLKKGMILGLFPEGARTLTGDIMNPKIGAGILSVEAGAPMIPILIDGAINTLSALHPEFKRTKVTLYIGDPIEPLKKSEQNNGTEIYQKQVDMWTTKVLEMQDTLTSQNND